MTPIEVREAYVNHRDTVYNLACRILRNEIAAEDVVQEVFSIALRSSFDGRSRIDTWLYRITYNKCIDALRKESRKLPEPEQVEVITPEAHFQQVQKIEGLLRAVEDLPDRRRYVLVSTAMGVPVEEIAKTLDVTETTCRSILCKTRAEIRKKVNKE